MIAIRIGTEYLKLPAGFSLQWDLLHPAFSESLLGGGYTFPIEFDRCPENDTLLNFAHKFDYNEQRSWEYKVSILKNGSFWREAKLYIDRPGTKKLGGYLRIGIEIFDVLDKKLEEVDYGGDILLDSDPNNVKVIAWNYNSALDWNTGGVCFPMIYNPEFYGDNNPDFKDYLNNFDFTLNEFYSNAANAPAPSNINCLVPMPYYLFVLKKIFEQEGYTLYNDSSLFTARGWDKEYMYSNYPLDALSDPHYKVRASGPAQNYVPGTSTVIINDDSTGLNYDPDGQFNTYLYEVAVAGAHRITWYMTFYGTEDLTGLGTSGDLVVALSSDVLTMDNISGASETSLTTLSGTITPVFDAGDIGSHIYLQLRLYSLPIDVVSVWIKIDALENSQVNVFNTTMNIKNHVPDKTVREFLTDLKNEWQIGYHLDEGKKEIRLIPNTTSLTQTPNNLTEKTDPDHEATPNTERIKLIGYNWLSDDDLVNDNFKQYDQGSDQGSFDGLVNFPTTNIIPGQTARDENTNRRYVATNPVGSTSIVWNFLRDDYDDFIIDSTAEGEWRLNNTPLFMYYDSLKDKYFPQISQQGSSEAFGLGVTRTSQRFAFFGTDPGVYFYVGSTTQPTLTGSSTGAPGSRFIMDGADAIELLAYHYQWLLLINGKFIWEKKANFNINDIEQLFLYMGSKGIIDPVHIDTIDFIIKKVSISESDKIDEVKLELLRLP
jgi:hypothetical protein